MKLKYLLYGCFILGCSLCVIVLPQNVRAEGEIQRHLQRSERIAGSSSHKHFRGGNIGGHHQTSDLLPIQTGQPHPSVYRESDTVNEKSRLHGEEKRKLRDKYERVLDRIDKNRENNYPYVEGNPEEYLDESAVTQDYNNSTEQNSDVL